MLLCIAQTAFGDNEFVYKGFKYRVLSQEEKTVALIQGGNLNNVVIPEKALCRASAVVKKLKWDYLTEGWSECDKKQVGNLKKQALIDLEKSTQQRKPISIKMRCSFQGEGALTFLMHSKTNAGMQIYLNIGGLDTDCTRESYAISHFGMENDRTYSTTINIPDDEEHFIEFCYSGVLSKDEVDELLATTEISLAPTANPTANISEYDVVAIGEGAFWNMPLESVEIPGSVKDICDYAFQYCVNLNSVKLSEGLESIGREVFAYCSSLPEIHLPEGLKYMDLAPFLNCPSLTNVSIPSTLKSIPPFAFTGCRNLNTVKFAGDVERIEEHAFLSCEALTDVKIPSGTQWLGDWSYKNCESVKHLLIPSTVKKIGTLAFDCCFSLESLYYYPIECEEAGTELFPMIDRCPKLQTLVIGDEVKSIPPHTFKNCTNLKNIIVLAPEPPAGLESVFSDVDKKNCTLQVPKGSESQYAAADVWKGFMNVEGIDPSGIPLAPSEGGLKTKHVYNLQGMPVLTTTDEEEISALPTGIYVVDGKKRIIKK